MKASVTATEMLKLLSLASSCLAVMKSRMSGWSTRMMPMLAPRRVPPCLIVSVAASKTLMNESGPRRDALGAEDEVVLGTHAREREAGAAAALVDEGGVLDGLEDRVHGVADGKHEARRELAELAPGVHERGAVGQELEVGHQPVERVLPLLDRGGGVVEAFGLGDGVGDAPEQRFGGLLDLAVLPLLEVTAVQHPQCIGRELDHCLLHVKHVLLSPRSRPLGAVRS